MNFVTHHDAYIPTTGTFLQGLIEANFWDIVEALGVPIDGDGYKVDWEQYVPSISYFPPESSRAKSPEYDLYAFGYRDILHNASSTQEIPWLFEVSEMNPFTFNVVMNTETAREKGIEDMDTVYVENQVGQRMKVKIHTMEGIHPRCIAMAHGSAHWLKGHAAEGRSGLLNALLMVEDKYFCPISQSIETSVRVKVYKEK